MNLVKIVTLLFLGLVFSCQTHSQTPGPKKYKLIVNLENAHFDSLYLHDYTEGRHIVIAGKKTKIFTWEIIIPDSVVWNSENMQLLASPYDPKSKLLQSLRFITNRGGKQTTIVNVGVEDENSYIFGTYLDTAQFAREHVIERIGSKDSITVGKLICQDFKLIIKDNNSDIAVRALDPFFSWFNSSNTGSVLYSDKLKFYTELSKTHPSSRFLMTNLATNLTLYKSKDDIKKIYKNFSNKHKNTIWAKHIEQFLGEKKFPNTSLATVNKNIKEKIIQDSSKYNLVIFTASWCKPCIEEIPLLKAIYKDLSKNIIFTYVSIDNKDGISSFIKLVQTKAISWRGLLAFQNVKDIKQKYFIEGIPHTILVCPNQDMKVIDVRRNDDRLKLYSIIKPLINHL